MKAALALFLLLNIFWVSTVADAYESRSLSGHTSDVRSVVYSPDGRTLASGSVDGTLRLWNVATGAVSKTLKTEQSVLAVSYAPDGQTLATGHVDGKVGLWDVATGELKQHFARHGSAVLTVAYSPDGSTLATGSVRYHRAPLGCHDG